MGDFHVAAGEEFMRAVEGHELIQKVSIVDCWRSGDYKVNGRWIFGDTIQPYEPRLLNYVEFSSEMGMNHESLRVILRSFDKMKVNEYRRMDGYHFFRVAIGFTKERGYVFIPDMASKPEYLPYYTDKLMMVHELDRGWYEIEGGH